MINLTGSDVHLSTIIKVSNRDYDRLILDVEAQKKMQASRTYIERRIASGETMYGVNTGFGAFSSVKISNAEIVQLQKNLIRSHCCGVGSPFSPEETRVILFLRANTLARGTSGVRPEVVHKILEFLRFDILPLIPSQGSVGASGDLAPLSHLALGLMGEGSVLLNGQKMEASEALQKCGITALELQAKEGLSLINGCQVMTAVGLLAVAKAQQLAALFDLGGAMSLEALRGSRSAFDPLISRERPHHGEAQTARNLLRLLGSQSEISESHRDCGKVQDAYSLRCMPAVHGAAKSAILQTRKTLEIEANSSTDNPLVFSEEGKVLSGGNFHGEPVAFALDFLCIAMSAQASISECRIEKLINPSMSDLPAFLAPHGGLNSGMMIVQVAAASLVSENKILSHPASVDSIPTSADKEDHVSMGTIAARKLSQIISNAQSILAMELLCAAQALDLLKPLRPNAGVQAAYEWIRSQVTFAEHDRVFADDINLIKTWIQNGQLLAAVQNVVGELEL